jgi:transcriptional regulator with XRE-family HTH domain
MPTIVISHIALVENGKRNPTAELILKVADLFNTTTDQLLRDELELDDAG